MDEIGIEAVTQRNVRNGGAGLRAFLDDLSFDGCAVGATLKMLERSA